MNLFDDYIESSAHKELLMKLRSLVLKNGQLKEEFKWSMPVYTKNGKDVCYIKDTKNGVNLGFTKAQQLKDPSGLLEGTGKDMRHIKINSVDSLIDCSTQINLLIDQAIALE